MDTDCNYSYMELDKWSLNFFMTSFDRLRPNFKRLSEQAVKLEELLCYPGKSLKLEVLDVEDLAAASLDSDILLTSLDDSDESSTPLYYT
jgi:hypothetical protein